MLALRDLNEAYINGEWTGSSDGGLFDVVDPATGSLIGQVANCRAEDAEQAIAAADAAFPAWAAMPAGERAKMLRTIGDLLVENADDLAALLTAENGKPLAEAKVEIQYGASYFHWFAEECTRIYGDIVPMQPNGTQILIRRVPVGVCAVITPWNFPNAMLARKMAAALGAGCTLVAKPAEDTPLSALALATLAEQAGVPKGVVNIVTSSHAAEVGETFTKSPLVKKLSFTGSTRVGRLLYAQSAPTMKRLSMELGGNAPFIVFDDADLDAAADGLMLAKFRNNGQTCVCANRVFVQASVVGEFSAKVQERVRNLVVGRGTEDGVTVGPLINRAAFEKVQSLVADATQAGATVLEGGQGHPAGDLFFSPTVLANVEPSMAVAAEEIFGPVLPILTFENEDEVIKEANNTEFGLAAYVYTQDHQRIWRLGETLEYGMIGTNTGVVSNAAAPFGGVKQSGFGREGSKYGLDDYLEIKCQHIGGLG